MSTVAAGGIIVSQTHVGGGGVARWSQLWQDPGPNGNDLDGDSICWQGFSLSQPAQIDGIEWWGTGACELGFQIEFWRQDPGTIAYQPLAVRESTPGVAPEARFRITPSDLTTSAGPGALTHFTLELNTPLDFAANDAANPRWFIGVIGLTQQAYVTWNWSQGVSGTATYQFVRGGFDGGGYAYRVLGDSRAILMSNVPEPATATTAAGLMVLTATRLLKRGWRQRGPTAPS